MFASWPFAVKFVVSVLVLDLLFYIKHWATHRVPAFWHFHAIHHSQREMTVLTDRRHYL